MGGKFVGEMNLHFDADKMLFTSLDKDRHYQVFEMDAAGKNSPAGDARPAWGRQPRFLLSPRWPD